MLPIIALPLTGTSSLDFEDLRKAAEKAQERRRTMYDEQGNLRDQSKPKQRGTIESKELLALVSQREERVKDDRDAKMQEEANELERKQEAAARLAEDFAKSASNNLKALSSTEDGSDSEDTENMESLEYPESDDDDYDEIESIYKMYELINLLESLHTGLSKVYKELSESEKKLPEGKQKDILYNIWVQMRQHLYQIARMHRELTGNMKAVVRLPSPSDILKVEKMIEDASTETEQSEDVQAVDVSTETEPLNNRIAMWERLMPVVGMLLYLLWQGVSAMYTEEPPERLIHAGRGVFLPLRGNTGHAKTLRKFPALLL